MHLCNNKACIEITHLQLGSHKQNIRDAVKDNLLVHTKLSKEDVLEIRELAAERKLLYKEIAARFNIHPNTVSGITLNKKRKEVF
jgi:hypothetical protein